MKRMFVAAVMAGLSVGMISGCGEETKTTEKKTTTTPGGTSSTETTKKTETKGENPPAPPK